MTSGKELLIDVLFTHYKNGCGCSTCVVSTYICTILHSKNIQETKLSQFIAIRKCFPANCV